MAFPKLLTKRAVAVPAIVLAAALGPMVFAAGSGMAIADETPTPQTTETAAATPPAAAAAPAPVPVPSPPPPGSIAKVILKTTTHGDGVPLVYPSGTPQVTVRNVLFPPGSQTPLHRHPVPLFAYMLEGELTITTQGEEPRIYKAGDAFMETTGWHVGHNATDKPARMISVYMGSTDLGLSITHK